MKRSDVQRVFRRLAAVWGDEASQHVDLTPVDIALWERVKPYTMTSLERIHAMAQAVEYVSRADIAGAIVECGVWRGGSMMAAALTLQRLGDERDLYLYDTFSGMVEPREEDVRWDGSSASSDFAEGWCSASVDEVRATMDSTGYPERSIHYVEGVVEQTIPASAPDAIAVLRLDTDWYESTRHELEYLYPRLAPGGVLLIDDYGHWRGSRRAVDEYFESRPILLTRVDYTGRVAVKPAG